MFQFLGEYQKAKEYYEKAIAIAIEMEKEQDTGTSELCFNPLANIRRPKNITRKHLSAKKKAGNPCQLKPEDVETIYLPKK